jgi:hypothetical protein
MCGLDLGLCLLDHSSTIMLIQRLLGINFRHPLLDQSLPFLLFHVKLISLIFLDVLNPLFSCSHFFCVCMLVFEVYLCDKRS